MSEHLKILSQAQPVRLELRQLRTAVFDDRSPPRPHPTLHLEDHCTLRVHSTFSKPYFPLKETTSQTVVSLIPAQRQEDL